MMTREEKEVELHQLVDAAISAHKRGKVREYIHLTSEAALLIMSMEMNREGIPSLPQAR